MAMILIVATLSASALPTTLPGPLTPRDRIVILNDANFTAVNGVVAGDGSATYPFVIAGWHIAPSIGSAIYIHNTSVHFVVRDNLLEGQIGLTLSDVDHQPLVLNNHFAARVDGIYAVNADPIIRDNAFLSYRGSGEGGVGVLLSASNARIESNAFNRLRIGIKAEFGSPTIVGNDMQGAHIHLGYVVNATVEANILTGSLYDGIYIEYSAIVHVESNILLNTRSEGIFSWVSKDVYMWNNTIRGNVYVAILWETSSGEVVGNTIELGLHAAIHVWHSPIFIANNTVRANLNHGLHFKMTTAVAVNNTFENNALGILVEEDSTPILEGNVMINNTVGMSIAYDSRATIALMHNNTVNSINIDGTVNASQQVYFYQQSNVTLDGVYRDGGFSAGATSIITAQGGVVLYDVNTATINNSIIAHQNIGVHAVNSFNVQVTNSALVSNNIGLLAETQPGVHLGPNCAVAIKDSNITIPIDPVATFGVDIQGDCFAIVARTNISLVATGIRVGATASANITDVSVTDTTLGLDIRGARDRIFIDETTAARNDIGARFTGTHGLVTDSTFADNHALGIELVAGADLQFERNRVIDNAGDGMRDRSYCAGSATCSTLTSEDNTFARNRGTGLIMRGPTNLRDDVFEANRQRGAELGPQASLKGITAQRNEGDGIHLTGTFDVRDTLVRENGRDGLDVIGVGDLRNITATRNDEAGIRLAPLRVGALFLNASQNLDGIVIDEAALSINSLISPTIALTDILGFNPLRLAGAPGLDVHLSTFEANLRDAIRTGSTPVNATHNYFGPLGPRINLADTVGAFQNSVSPNVRHIPYYTDRAMTTTGPVPGL